MDPVTKESLLSAVRTLLGAGGGVLVAHGYLSSGTANELLGALMILIPIGWGAFQKWQSEKKTQVREVAAVNAGVAVADSGTVGATVRPRDVPAIIANYAPDVHEPPLPL